MQPQLHTITPSSRAITTELAVHSVRNIRNTQRPPLSTIQCLGATAASGLASVTCEKCCCCPANPLLHVLPTSRQVRAVDVGDVHIPLERGSGSASTSARDARRHGEQGSGSRQRAQGKHPWDRMTFFFASDSERTKMLLEELRARRAQERTAGSAPARQAGSRGTAAGSAAAGGGGGGGGPLDRVSTSSSALWADIGRGGALGPGQPHDPALPCECLLTAAACRLRCSLPPLLSANVHCLQACN